MLLMRTWKDHRGFEHMIVETDEEARQLHRIIGAYVENSDAPVPWHLLEGLRNYDLANERAEEAMRGS